MLIIFTFRQAIKPQFSFFFESTDAIVVDISALEKKHLKLLDFIREKDVELLGVGDGRFPAGFSVDDLNGMKWGTSPSIRERILTLARQKDMKMNSTDLSVRLRLGKYASQNTFQKGKKLTP